MKLRGSKDDKIFASKVFNDAMRLMSNAEVLCLKMIDHPNIVKMVESFGVNHDGTAYKDLLEPDQQVVVVLNFVEG